MERNFSDLYNRLEYASTNYDNQFYIEAINHKNHFQEEMYDNRIIMNC